MREILFRGKRMYNGEWVYGWPFADTADCSLKKDGKCECPHDGSEYFIVEWVDDYNEYEERQVIPNTVGQYTGLKDKNGKRIFEGDILRHYNHSTDTGKYEVGKVFFDRYSACFKRTSNPGAVYLGKRCTYEIIGNIHDNPELLKGFNEEV